MLETLTLMLIGALTGILAGLLGVGGGLVVVPALAFWLPLRGISPADALHAAVATSLASICVTSVASAWAHYRRGAVDLRAIGWLTPGLLLGSSGGAIVVAGIPAPVPMSQLRLRPAIRWRWGNFPRESPSPGKRWWSARARCAPPGSGPPSR